MRFPRSGKVAANIPSETIDVYCNALDEVFDTCISGTVMPSTTQYNLPTSLAQNLAVVTKQLQTPYMKHFLALDSRPLLGNITCPVLALNGTKDTQVDSESNLDALRSGLQKNAKNKLEAIEGVNHLFQHCKTNTAILRKPLLQRYWRRWFLGCQICKRLNILVQIISK